MTKPNERDFVASMYPTPRWRAKVGRMSDAQVHAIYMKEQDREAKAKKAKENQEKEDW